MKYLIFFLISFLLVSNQALAETDSLLIYSDPIEAATGLKKVKGERFLIDLKYNSNDNFLEKNVYVDFGLADCYVHPDVYDKLLSLTEPLKEKQLKLVLFDCYRPLEAQRAMWALCPDTRYVASPKAGSPHNRGVALDCGLADENGVHLDFPTEFDAFTIKSWQNYECSPEERRACENRELLKYLMLKVGLQPINTEWWHFQLPEAKAYPIISINEAPRR